VKRSPLGRKTPLKRTTPIKRARLRPGRRVHPDREAKLAFQRAAQQQLACMNPACPCPSAPWNAHHIVYRQHLRALGADEWPPELALRLCTDCHDRYHARSLRLTADMLPPTAVAFAVRLLGAERAAAYLDRYYPA
jgi:hypothetical protein